MTAVGAGLNAAIIAVGASQTGKSYTMGTSGPPRTALEQVLLPISMRTLLLTT